jgi:hypothetical protein
MKTYRITLEVRQQNGEVLTKVEARGLGLLAVHRRALSRRGWVISHVPTGMRIHWEYFKTKREAMSFLREVSNLGIDWRFGLPLWAEVEQMPSWQRLQRDNLLLRAYLAVKEMEEYK